VEQEKVRVEKVTMNENRLEEGLKLCNTVVHLPHPLPPRYRHNMAQKHGWKRY
jgi:hypothetical protein